MYSCPIQQHIAEMWLAQTGHLLPKRGEKLRFRDSHGEMWIGTVVGLCWSVNFIHPDRPTFFVKVLADRKGKGNDEWGVEPKDAIYEQG